MMISIHAPAQGATENCSSHLSGSDDFNPRSRTGSDPRPRAAEALLSDFNPRSRTGSDSASANIQTYSWHFNPRSRTGSDRDQPDFKIRQCPFQSTLPHGERLNCGGYSSKQIQFQSTLPHGERQQKLLNMFYMKVYSLCGIPIVSDDAVLYVKVYFPNDKKLIGFRCE